MRKLAFVPILTILSSPAFASLDLGDTSIIVLHQLNEQTSGQLNNAVDQSFLDTAVTGVAQNHEDFSDGASDGPAWSSGALFESGGNAVGTGTGLSLTKSDNDHSRFEPWQNQSEGFYTEGGSFTLMMRINAHGVADNTSQSLTGTTSNFLSLSGRSTGTDATVGVRLREGAGGGETAFLYDSLGAGGATTAAGSFFTLNFNTWYNVFLIYDANASVTVAIDDGSTFSFIRTTDIAGISFDSLTHGFSDSNRSAGLGTLAPGTGLDTFDGEIESLVVFDRVLTDLEADAIDLDNLVVPEPATLIMVGVGLLMVLPGRKKF